MTRKQIRERKAGNQARKARFLKLYYKVKPSKLGWIENPGFIQNGKYTRKAKL